MQFKALVLALVFGAATAFMGSPVQHRVAKSSKLSMIVEEEIGALPPLGVWDPQGFIEREPEKFARRRAVERKHGRIAMVAVVGLLTTNAGLTWPGYISKTFDLKFSDIRPGIYGLLDVPPLGLAQIIVFIGLLETVYFDGLNYSGDYGTGYFGKFLPPDQKAKKLNIELNNGRAAMAGILGMMADEFITGQTLAERHLFPF